MKERKEVEPFDYRCTLGSLAIPIAEEREFAAHHKRRSLMHRQTTTICLLGLAALLSSTLTTVPLVFAGTAVKAELIGYEETPAAVSSTCEGQFRAKISNDNSQIEFALSYANLEGT